MMNGSECSTSANPLSSLLKQQNQDRSLHQTNFSQQPGSSSQSLRTHTPNGQIAHEDADRFFQQQGGPAFANMDGLRRELESVSRGSPQSAMKGDREWASQYSPAGTQMNPQDMQRMEEQFRMQQQQQGRPSDLSAEFWHHQQQQQNGPGPSFASPEVQQPTYQPRTGFAPSYGAYGGMGMMGGGMGGMYAQPHVAQAPVQEGKGKGRFIELDEADWETQFARAEEKEEVAETKEAEKKEPLTTEQKTQNLLDGDVDLDASAADAELMKSLEATWSNLQSTLSESSAISDADMAQWEAQYGAQLHDGSEDLDDNYGLATPEIRKTWTKDNVDSFLADQEVFPFSAQNDYLTHPDPFAEGQRLLAEGAPLSEAAMAFEAACKLDETRGEAWKAAGETWAADEREVKGIRALEKAVACGGKDGVGAWMSLAVAYVNEGQELRALATLERWLTLAYPSISPPTTAGHPPSTPWDASNRIIDLFLGAARAGPMARTPGQSDELAEVDPDVQVGLGVLFYSNSDYGRARDCFEAALSVRPNDFLLWNRLGATLANGGLPEEAISAYRRALDLRPTFTRAIYNLGVSCLNIGCYHEAAEHLLAAIEGQQSREGAGKREGDLGPDEDGSANLWHTLRRSFLCMERHDLAERAQPGSNVAEFRAEGFEF